MSGHGKHPDEEALALLAGGDLPLLERWRVGRHVRSCAECAEVLAEYRRLRSETAHRSDDLVEAAWSHLEAEMRANIRLGLAAGAALGQEPVRVPVQQPGWRLAATAASLAFVFGAGVWLGNAPSPARFSVAVASMQPTVEAGIQGVALRKPGAALELMSPEGSAAVRTVSWDGTARARYFDGDTGQVTIHQVAWEESDAK